MIGSTTFIAWLVSALAMSASWIKLFSTAEDHVTDGTKRRIRRWFAPQDGDEGERPGWAEGFIETFDRTFGIRFLSWRFFLRSCVASLVIFAILILAMVGYGVLDTLLLDRFVATYTDDDFQDVRGIIRPASGWTLVALLLGPALISNFLADYLSLIESRLALKLMRGRSASDQMLIVLGDIVLTVLIYFAVASVFYGLGNIYLYPDYSLADQLKAVVGMDTPRAKGFGYDVPIYEVVYDQIFTLSGDPYSPDESTLWSRLYQISFLTTFFTSVWIWLFVLAGMLGRLVLVVKGRLTRFGRYFKVNEKPLTTVGYVLALITFVLHVTVFAGWHVWQAVTPPDDPAASQSTPAS